MAPQLRHVGLSLGVLLGLASLDLGLPPAHGQQPTTSTPATPAANAPNQTGRNATAVPGHDQPRAHRPIRRRSIVHHYPYPYPGYYHGDDSAGFRNPGGVGRHAEYYPPGDRFQVEQDPIRVARFNEGGYPSRSEQLAAQQVGIQRYNSIQNHIDNYARPYFGYGFGVGRFGGFW
jgi:hypothetical protein